MAIKASSPTSVQQLSSPTMQIDWREYWKTFQEVHGGNPVEFEGRLLFQDGWTHSKTDYKGPEWPPPEGGVERLQLAYWRIRLKIVTEQRNALLDVIKSIRGINQNRSAPLKHWVTVQEETEAGERQVRRLMELSEDSYTERLADLEHDIVNCEANIGAMNG